MELQDKIECLAGDWRAAIKSCPMKPYSDAVCDFLDELSRVLLADHVAKNFSDIISFAFWCRRSNVQKLKADLVSKELRLGQGVVFHIAPSNVPINFAFSYAFSLLAGNANIVRVPSRTFPQIDIVSKIIDKILKDYSYSEVLSASAFVRYEHDDEITGYFSSVSDARIIWGGDETIKAIRRLPIKERGIDIAFADRYSLSIFGTKAIAESSQTEISRLAQNFYNDTYLMDQNACSSPQLIIWYKDQERLEDAKKKFWAAVENVVASKYKLQAIHAVDKYTQFCENAIDIACPSSMTRDGNYIYRLELKKLPKEGVDSLRGKCGYFFEHYTEDLNVFVAIVNKKFQTLTYFGVDAKAIGTFVIDKALSGIDRIVPVGSALDISVIWDGYDLVRMLSRIVDIR